MAELPNKVLALKQFPLPKWKTELFAPDLETEKQIEELFDYCQILEATITRDGWLYLIETFGYSNLYQINKRSEWIDVYNLAEFKIWVNYYLNESV